MIRQLFFNNGNKKRFLIEEYQKALNQGNKPAALFLIEEIILEEPGNKAARHQMGTLRQEIKEMREREAMACTKTV